MAATTGAVATEQAAAQNVTATAQWQEKDDDKDGLTNNEEEALGTNPNNRDNDGDGLFDGDEIRKFNTNPFNPDTDYDGILDSEEIRLNLDPLSRDTDLDGTPDSTDEDPGQAPTPTPTLTPNPLPLIRFSNTSYFVREDEGQTIITVILDAASTRRVAVNYSLNGNTAVAGSDFRAVSGTLFFEPGQTVQSFVAPIIDDNISGNGRNLNDQPGQPPKCRSWPRESSDPSHY